jgi:hypothetical protein
MPKGAAHRPDGWKLGRPHEVESLARLGCARFPRQKVAFCTVREVRYGGLAEPHTDAEREVLMKLLTDEQAKEPPPENEILKPR